MVNETMDDNGEGGGSSGRANLGGGGGANGTVDAITTPELNSISDALSGLGLETNSPMYMLLSNLTRTCT